MAATTSGWQCPVEVTAMPAEKSRNSLPSTSSTITPRPRFATSGYDRVYDGEIKWWSPSRTRLAFGPGSAVLILGPATGIKVLVVMVFSCEMTEGTADVPNFCLPGTDVLHCGTQPQALRAEDGWN